MSHLSFFFNKKNNNEDISSSLINSFDELKIDIKNSNIKNSNKKNKNPNTGYLYVLYNSVFKEYGENIYKLGRTNNLENRMKSYTTSYIDPSTFLYKSKQFEDCIKTERILFFLLRQYRIKDKREFFNLNLDLIITTIKKIEELSTIQINKIYNKILNKICPNDILENKEKLQQLNDEDYYKSLDFDHSEIKAFLEQFRFKPLNESRYKMYNYTPPQTSELNYLIYQVEMIDDKIN